MLNYAIRYGAIAGIIVGGLMLITVATADVQMGALGMAMGYATMLIALSAIFVAIKRFRDTACGGVIGFWRALGLGLAISAIAGLFYVAAWEIALATFAGDFMADYAEATIAQRRAAGADAATLAAARAEMEAFAASYANPLVRLPLSFAEIFPVGVLVSLVSAAILRNPRVMPARRAAVAD